MSQPALQITIPEAKPPAGSRKRVARKFTEVKRGNVVLRIRQYPKVVGGRRYTEFRVRHRNDQGGTVVKRTTNWQVAREYADGVATNIANGTAWRDRISHEEFSAARNDQAALAGLLKEFADAKTSPRAALEFWRRHHPADVAVACIRDVVGELVQAKRSRGFSAEHVTDLEVRLNRFARDFQCPINALTCAAVDRWLRELKKPDGSALSLRSRNNYRSAIVLLIDYAKKVKALPRDWNELEAIEPAKTHGKKIEIWSPGEITLLLQSAETLHGAGTLKDLVPYLAIGAFAGCRSAEIRRLDWRRNIRLETSVIKIAKDLAGVGIAKTRRSRDVPMKPNLAAWLAPYSESHGCVCPCRKASELHAALRKIARHAGLPWKKNGLRDSSISYNVGTGVGLETVADWHGNSVSEIHENYLLHPDRADAEAYFNILPGVGGQKLLTLKFG